MKNDHIKIAGLGLNWTKDFAPIYKDSLFEVGFIAVVIEYSNAFYVAYSHKEFAKRDAETILQQLIGGEEHDKPEDIHTN